MGPTSSFIEPGEVSIGIVGISVTSENEGTNHKKKEKIIGEE